MFGDDILVRTLLLPPRLPRLWLARDRLDHLLSSIVEYPLAIVSASAGYGKSTALAAFAANGGYPTIWYTFGEGCDDPLVFLVHLVHACRGSLAPQAGTRTLDILERGGSGPQVWGQALDTLVNDLVPLLTQETLLVLDDYHRADDSSDIRALIDRLIAVCPPRLHLVLSTRRRPQLECLSTLQVRGELLEITEHDLAFTEDEIAHLFGSVYGHELDPQYAPSVSQQTGGWAIALQLVWQSLAQDRRPTTDDRRPNVNPQSAIRNPQFLAPESREALFAYLAREVLARQSPDVRLFLLRSSVLSQLQPAACDYVLGITGSAARLDGLFKRGLFLIDLGAGLYRYHPLFHSFLQERAATTLPEWRDLHVRAAGYYREAGMGEQVLYHLMATGNTSGAALELERWVQSWLESGRLVTLLAWIDQLPEETLTDHPRLLIARGDASRLLAHFDTAQQAYEQAVRTYESDGDRTGQAQALRGQAIVYLDTVQPARAEALLRQAFRLLPPGEWAARADLLGLIAENRLNQGRADQALRILDFGLRVSDHSSSPAQPSSEANGRQAPPSFAKAANGVVNNPQSKIENRALLRLGRLAEARANLEAELQSDRESVSQGRPSDAHREITILLSLIGSLEGDPVAALRYAQEGLDAARQLGSSLFEAGAHICAGHALQLAHPEEPGAANEHYLQAMALADAIQVRRTKAEAYMGLALLHGFRGDLAAAQDAGREGLSIVEQSGDAWTAAQLWTALGAVATANGSPDAQDYLNQALKRYLTAKDTYGQAVAHLWLSIMHYRGADPEQAAHHAIVSFELAQRKPCLDPAEGKEGRSEYDGLLIAPTLFGPRDRMMLVPVLLAARSDPAWSAAAQSLLNRGFPAIAASPELAKDNAQFYHPGVTLRIQALGPLRVWRGSEEIGPHEWQRKKAQQMLALLVTYRDRWLLREQICDRLWPEEAPSEAETQFKVTLNGLNAALEPLRPPRVPPFYIRRQGSSYRFYPPGGVWLDVAEFEELLATAREGRVTNHESRITNHELDNHRTTDEQSIRNGESRHLALTRAVELYQGEYLSDLLYEDWARDERERLEVRYIEAATLLAESLVGRHELSEAIRLCELVLARDPGWEDAYCVLMRAYAQQGQRRLALSTYERCVRNLRDYLDVAPLPSTVRIYEEVKG